MFAMVQAQAPNAQAPNAQAPATGSPSPTLPQNFGSEGGKQFIPKAIK